MKLLYDDLEVWDGGWWEAEEGGYMDIYIHIYITDSFCCIAETNTNYKATMHACMHATSLQLCPTLCNRMNCNLLGSSAHGILQARMLKCVAIPFSRDKATILKLLKK